MKTEGVSSTQVTLKVYIKNNKTHYTTTSTNYVQLYYKISNKKCN